MVSGASQVPQRFKRQYHSLESFRPGVKTPSAAAPQSAEAEQPAAAHQPEQSAGESLFQKRPNLPVDKGVLDIIKRLRELTFAAAAQPASAETKEQPFKAADNRPFNFGDPSAAANPTFNFGDSSAAANPTGGFDFNAGRQYVEMYGFKRRKIAHRLKQNTQKRHDYTQALSDKLKRFSNFVAYYNQILFSHSKPVVMEFFNLITDAGLKDIYQKIADLTMFCFNNSIHPEVREPGAKCLQFVVVNLNKPELNEVILDELIQGGVFPEAPIPGIKTQKALSEFLYAFINKLNPNDLRRITRAITDAKIESMIRQLNSAYGSETHLYTFIDCMITLANNDDDFRSRLKAEASDKMDENGNSFANYILNKLQQISPQTQSTYRSMREINLRELLTAVQTIEL